MPVPVFLLFYLENAAAAMQWVICNLPSPCYNGNSETTRQGD